MPRVPASNAHMPYAEDLFPRKGLGVHETGATSVAACPGVVVMPHESIHQAVLPAGRWARTSMSFTGDDLRDPNDDRITVELPPLEDDRTLDETETDTQHDSSMDETEIDPRFQ